MNLVLFVVITGFVYCFLHSSSSPTTRLDNQFRAKSVYFATFSSIAVNSAICSPNSLINTSSVPIRLRTRRAAYNLAARSLPRVCGGFYLRSSTR